MSLDGKLYRALHGTFSADRAWADARKAGATDAELGKLIEEEFGIEGGFTDDDGGASYANGLRFWDSGLAWGKKPTLQGPALIEAARRVLRIGQPATVSEQRDLFQDTRSQG